MKRRTNILVQVLSLVGATVTSSTDVVPPDFRPFAIALAGVLQGTVGLIAHHHNTDGTPQEVAFKK